MAEVHPKNPVEWAVSHSLVTYPQAVTFMEERVQAIAEGKAPELVWLLEHPPLYTAGTSAQESDLISPDRFPVFKSGRGGQYTYHGPGQRVAYLMLNLKERGADIRCFVRDLETWLIKTLEHLGIQGDVKEGRVGVWVERPDIAEGREDKIAALGIRVRKWVSFHGISLNVAPDLSHFSGIIPCGITEHGLTSLKELQAETNMEKVDRVLQEEFIKLFGPTNVIEAPSFQ